MRCTAPGGLGVLGPQKSSSGGTKVRRDIPAPTPKPPPPFQCTVRPAYSKSIEQYMNPSILSLFTTPGKYLKILISVV